jgi:hypothetical protein
MAYANVASCGPEQFCWEAASVSSLCSTDHGAGATNRIRYARCSPAFDLDVGGLVEVLYIHPALTEVVEQALLDL